VFPSQTIAETAMIMALPVQMHILRAVADVCQLPVGLVGPNHSRYIFKSYTQSTPKKEKRKKCKKKRKTINY